MGTSQSAEAEQVVAVAEVADPGVSGPAAVEELLLLAGAAVLQCLLQLGEQLHRWIAAAVL